MMKKIGLFIPPKEPSAGSQFDTGLVPENVREEIITGLRAQGAEVFDGLDHRRATVESGRVYLDDICLSDLDLFFWYYPIRDRRSDGYEFSILRALAQTTLVIPNPDGLLRGFDKFTSHTLLRAAGVPTSDFALFSATDTTYAKKLLSEWGSLVLKPTLGSFGQGIVKIETERMLLDTIAYAQSFSNESLAIFAERFEPSDMSRWTSVTMIGDTIAYGYRKNADKIVDGWKVYDENCIGGGVSYVNPREISDFTKQAKIALDADIIGFDFIYSTRLKQYLVVDENTFPGMYADCFAASPRGSWSVYFLNLIKQSLN